MNLTLLVENNAQIEAFYRLSLYTWLGLEIAVSKNATEAKEFIHGSMDKNIQLIIVRSQIGKEQTAQEVTNFLKENKLEVPVIVIGPGQKVPGTVAHMSNSLQLKTMIQGAAKALGITAQAMTAKEVPDFFPIPISFFLNLKRSVCAVYAQEKSGKILLFEKMKDFTSEQINELISKGTTTLYIDKLDRLDFVNNLTAELMTTLKDEQLSPAEQLSAADTTLQLAARKLATLGITEETIQICHRSMDTLKKNTRGSPKLSKLLDKLLANKTSYLFTHTQILSYVGLHIIKNIDWGNPEQEEKILFIAFFHDIALEKDAHGRISSQVELKKADLSDSEKALVEKHAQIAAELVSKFPHAPMGSDQIIRQHHGTLNGVGFSEHFGNNVSPMSIVFIVAEEFTRIILKYAEDTSVTKEIMLRELKETFPTTRFQKVIETVHSIMI